MRLYVLLSLLIANILCAAGQASDLLTELENSTLQVRQKPGTDALLRNWLGRAGVKEDTVYAYIYMPGSCPRCENSIKDYKEYINSKGGKFLLITVFRDKATAAFYNKKKGYEADYYIYDTENYYKQVLSFNNFALDGSDMLKLTRQGRLITGYDGMNYSRKLAELLMRRSKPMDYRDFGGSAETDSTEWVYRLEYAEALPMNGGHKDYKLDVKPEAPLCETYRNPYFRDDVFFYPDELLSSVPVYRKEKDTGKMAFVAALAPDSTEKDMFIDLDAETYNMLARKDNLYYIVCYAGMLDDGHIGLSYSLPRIFFQAEDHIAYFNKTCILSRNIGDLSKSRFFVPDYDVMKEQYSYNHFQFSSTGGNVFMGCQKNTWPMSFEPDEYKDNPAFNPFCEEFYVTDNPFMAEFDRHTGKLIRRFGKLDSLAEKTMTGYYYVNAQSTVGGSEIAYTDGYSGKVYVADTSAVADAKACYSAFN